MIAVAIFLTVFPFIVDFSWGLVAAAIFILLGGVVYVIMVHLNVQPPMGKSHMNTTSTRE